MKTWVDITALLAIVFILAFGILATIDQYRRDKEIKENYKKMEELDQKIKTKRNNI